MTTENEQLAARFARDGVLHLPGVLDAAELAELQAQLDRYIRDVAPNVPPADAFYETPGDLGTLKQMQRIEQHDAWFAELPARRRFVELAETLLGTAVVSQGVEWFNKPAGTGRPTPPHQDGFYFCLVPDEAVTIWIALEDVDRQNGCLHYAVGSHLGGIRPHGTSQVLGFSQTILDFDPDACERTLVAFAKPGDVLVHHSATVHWAGANRSQRSRRSCGLVYYSARARRDEAAFARYLASSRQQQRALGAV